MIDIAIKLCLSSSIFFFIVWQATWTLVLLFAYSLDALTQAIVDMLNRKKIEPAKDKELEWYDYYWEDDND